MGTDRGMCCPGRLAAPVVSFVTPAEDQPFQLGDTVPFQVAGVDAPVDRSTVTVTYTLGHDQHGHPLSTASRCTGWITTFVDGGQAGADDPTAVFVAAYNGCGLAAAVRFGDGCSHTGRLMFIEYRARPSPADRGGNGVPTPGKQQVNERGTSNKCRSPSRTGLTGRATINS